MEMKARVAEQPAMNQGGLVGAVVIEDEVNVEVVGNFPVDAVEEATKLDGAMLTVDFTDDFPGGNVERGEKGSGAVPAVVVGPALWLTGTHREDGLASIQRLDLSLLVGAEDQRPLKRIQIQTDYVADLLHQLWVVGQLECVGAMGLKPKCAPNPVDGRAAEAARSGHGAGTPVSRVFGGGLQRLHDDRFDLVVADLARGTTTGLVEQTRSPSFDEAPAPLANRAVDVADLAGDRGVRQSIARQKNDACARSQRMRGLPSRDPTGEGLPVLGRHHQLCPGSTSTHRKSPHRVRIQPLYLNTRTSETGH